MAEYVEIEDGIKMPGLRVTLVPGHAGPWAEAAKGILHVKKIPFVRVRHRGTDPHYMQILENWSGQTSYPIAAYNDERPRTIWTEILFLAERLAPEPVLIPFDAEERALMFGYSHELCGELGLCWSQRLMGFEKGISSGVFGDRVPLESAAFQRKYGYSPAAAVAAPARIVQIMELFATQLDRQYSRGRRFLVGNSLSALDIYWATFISRIYPLPEDLCRMELRSLFAELFTNHPRIKAATRPILLTHRDFIYHTYLELPVVL